MNYKNMTLTPEQFDNLVTRVEFSEKTDKIILDILVIKDEFSEFKREMNEFREESNVKLDAIMTTLDGIAKIVGVNDTERVSNIAAHDRFETRITRTEKELNLEPIFS